MKLPAWRLPEDERHDDDDYEEEGSSRSSSSSIGRLCSTAFALFAGGGRHRRAAARCRHTHYERRRVSRLGVEMNRTKVVAAEGKRGKIQQGRARLRSRTNESRW